MALTREDLQAIAELMDTKLEPIQQDMQDMKDEMLGMKDEIQGMKGEMLGMKDEMLGMKDEIQGMKGEMLGMKDQITGLEHTVQQMNDKITDTRLHLENVTDRNIKLLAENHITLIDKLNESIPSVNKNLTYEIKVNYLFTEVEKLKVEVENLKTRTA